MSQSPPIFNRSELPQERQDLAQSAQKDVKNFSSRFSLAPEQYERRTPGRFELDIPGKIAGALRSKEVQKAGEKTTHID